MISCISNQKKNVSYLIIVFNISHVKGNGYGSIFVVAFRVLKSIQIFNLPFFQGTTTMGDNHVVSFIDSMNLATKNLSIFCLTTIT